MITWVDTKMWVDHENTLEIGPDIRKLADQSVSVDPQGFIHRGEKERS